MPSAAVGAIEAHDVVVLIFNPDAPQEAALAGLFLRSYVEHQATHFAEKLAPYVVELVVLFVEAVRVNEDHLQETVRQELHRERKEISNRSEDLLSLAFRVAQP